MGVCVKKIWTIAFIILVLLIGIKIGGKTNYDSFNNDLFEIEKERFETEIVDPNNSYENIDLRPKEYLPNKVAKTINNILEKILKKLT